MNTLTEQQAYLAMFRFLESIYATTQSDDIGGLLGSMSLLADGGPADSAFRSDWAAAVRAALDGEVDAGMRSGPPT
jgi:hypothetical protein